MKILILEGNGAFAEELKEYFSTHEGYEVCGITDDGAEGLRLMEEKSPNAVILSLLLKNVDGFSVLEQGLAKHRKTAFLVLGSFSDDKIVNRAMSLGASYYLMRPVSAELIAERLSQLAIDGESGKKGEQVERKKFSSLDEKIANIFITIGIPPHIKGYNYLREGIKLAVEDPSIINNITKGLYPMIAERYRTTPSKVERAIRHAIEVAWNRGRIDAVNAIFGVRVYIGTEKPTNSEFIALVADKLILESMA